MSPQAVLINSILLLIAAMVFMFMIRLLVRYYKTSKSLKQKDASQVGFVATVFILMPPLTSSDWVGAVVPMPTLPEEVILMRSGLLAVAVPTLKTRLAGIDPILTAPSTTEARLVGAI